jgi:hypothetical protein
MATRKPTPKPLPIQARRPAPLDLVRNPNFDAAMAQQNYDNFIAGQRARMAAQNTSGQQRDPNKEIVLNFAGGQFGIANDEAANAIAKKYNLDIVKKPITGSNVPTYLFRSNGDVNNIISQIKNEQGIGYVEPNSIMSTGFGDTTQRGAGSQQSTNSTAGYAQVDPNTNAPSLMPIEIGGSMSGGTGDPRFIYNNLPYIYQPENGTIRIPSSEDQNAKNFGQIAQGIGRLMPQMPQFPQGQQQQMQNYQNFLNQGMNSIASMNQDSMTNFANMQPGMPTTEPAQTSTAKPTMPVAGFGMQKSKVQPVKPSTFSNTPARFF